MPPIFELTYYTRKKKFCAIFKQKKEKKKPDRNGSINCIKCVVDENELRKVMARGQFENYFSFRLVLFFVSKLQHYSLYCTTNYFVGFLSSDMYALFPFDIWVSRKTMERHKPEVFFIKKLQGMINNDKSNCFHVNFS